jgi:hypothetical protein
MINAWILFSFHATDETITKFSATLKAHLLSIISAGEHGRPVSVAAKI